MKIAFLFTLFLIIHSGQINADEKINMGELWRKYTLSLPDCAYAYTMEVYGKKINYEYASSSGRYVLTEFSGDGAASEIFTYDGSTYYSLFNSGVQLTLSSEKPEQPRRFAMRYRLNPLYIPLAIISEGSFFEFGDDFYPPHILRMNVVKDRINKIVPTLTENGVELLYKDKRKNLKFSSNGLGKLSGASWVVSPGLIEKWTVGSYEKLKNAEGELFDIPCLFERVFLDESGNIMKSPNYPNMKIRIEKNAFKFLPKNVDQSRFQVPKSAARILRDSDIGVDVEMNPEVKVK